METHHLDFKKIEEKWQKRWEEARIFEADVDPSKPKFFITVAYPYVNAPQHIGHGRTYGLTDVYARYKRMRGFNVLYPQGFHYTGTPILGMAKRVAKQDNELINEFNKIFHIPLDVIRRFSDPLTLAKYFHNELKLGMKEMGYSIDWRREFTTIDPIYSKFIQWQFRTLSSKGYLVKGTHPVGWCPSDNNPVGQHDTQGDVEPEIVEVTLLKFKLSDGTMLPVATYRPETIFGVTNIWVNSEVDYRIADVDGEKWLASKECFEKLKYQSKKVNISTAKVMHGSDLVGQVALNPETGGKCLVLPASFVDPKTGTGVVMSVPGHAPYDYLALRDLKEADALERLSKQFGLDPSRVKQISPVSIVKVSGYSDCPAVDVVERMKVKSQTDPKAEEATKEVYLKEFNEGVMKGNAGKYAGMSVSNAKDQVKFDLEKKGTAERFYELTGTVRCRCGSECIVKVLENQWFINYGDPEWKKAVSQHLERMRIVPDDLRQEYRNTIGWLKYRACARQSGLGTKLPQAPEWIVESLSDSTIYMAYYTIAKYIRAHDLKEGQFNDDVFDYVFLGKGNPVKLTREVGLSKDILESMRSEFLYWYPLDSRHSATELIPNHLTFFIFNHVAIFLEAHWPRQIVTNGMVLMESKKMSKSIGNIIPIRDAVRRYGADTIKLAVLGSAELLSDANFGNSLADTIQERLEKFHNFVAEIVSKIPEAGKSAGTKQPPPLQSIDRWMLSVLQHRVAQTTEALENCEVREGIQQSFFMLDLDLNWYFRRIGAEGTSKDDNNGKRTISVNYVLTNVVDTWIRLLAPFAPHICEEAWEKFNKKGFVSTTSWPSPSDELIDIEAEEQENYVMKVSEDTREITRVTNIKPKRVFYYTSPRWMHDVYILMLEAVSKREGSDVGSIIKAAMSKPYAKGKEKSIAKYIQSAYNSVIKVMPRHLVERRVKAEFNERLILDDALKFLKSQFPAEIKVYDAEDKSIHDPAKKASFAQPYRPSIYIEG